MKEIKPNYDDCITNLACSILKYFDVPYKHNTIGDIDNLLNEFKPKNVVVILYDGMGYNLLNRILPDYSFLRNHCIRSISSVCPSTTTASTTSMLSGLNPCEHGWLGWDLYLKSENKIVTLFTNKLKDTDTYASKENLATKYMPYKTLTEQINESSPYSSSIVFPFGNHIVYKNIDDMMDKIVAECNKEGRRYIYVYYEDPDGIMHDTGTDSKETKDTFELIDRKTKELCDRLEDTVVIVTADHGHINSSGILISDYKDFKDTLSSDVSIEARFCSFKVKKEKKEEFERLFNLYFSKYFILKTKEQIINEHYFGYGKEHYEFKRSLGDYCALAISDKYFRYSEDSVNLKSMHAGLTEDEMRIPLILIRK